MERSRNLIAFAAHFRQICFSSLQAVNIWTQRSRRDRLKSWYGSVSKIQHVETLVILFSITLSHKWQFAQFYPKDQKYKIEKNYIAPNLFYVVLTIYFFTAERKINIRQSEIAFARNNTRIVRKFSLLLSQYRKIQTVLRWFLNHVFNETIE